MDGEKITTNSQSEEQPVAIEFQFPAVPIVSIMQWTSLCTTNVLSQGIQTLQRNIFEELVVRCVFWDFGNDSNRYI